MPPLESVTSALWLLTVLGGAAAVIQLYRFDLHAVYPYFFAYLALRTLRSAALFIFLKPNTAAYGWIWVLTQPLVWIFYVLILLELYALVLRGYRGIYTLSRWLLALGLASGVAVSMASYWLAHPNGPEKSPVLQYYVMVERGVDSTLVIFLFVLIAFLVWYPVPLSRNVRRHAMVYSVFFLSTSAALLARHVFGAEVNHAVNTALLGISSLCTVLWCFVFSPRGEEVSEPLRLQAEAADGRRLVEQLGALNRSLSRSIRN